MPTASATQIVRCQTCGANNRVSNNLAAAQTPVCGRCKTFLIVETRPVIVTDANFAEQIAESTLPVLLDLWAPWCGPCRLIAPVIDQLASELAGRVRVGKLNVDENPRTATRFGAQSIPTLLILKNGSEVDRLVGAQSKEAIWRRLQIIV